MLRQPFDIVHHASATPRNLVAATLAKARSFGKCVHIFTAPIQPHENDQYYQQYVTSIYRADVLAAVSHAVAEDIYAKFGRKVDAVIPSGVDLNFFAPTKSQPIDLEQLGINQPYVLFVGILTPRKRPDIFMQLASLLPHLDFVMVGGFYNGQEKQHYTEAAQAYPNLKMLGYAPRSMVRDLMAGTISLVFPSELEGLPLTVLEASAMGVPILAQPKTSMPEAIIPDVTGWMLPGDQLQLWADRLREISCWSNEQRQCFAQKARNFVAENYSWDVVAKQYGQLYVELAT
ncbi:glycosyltransferase family 4 protein [Leptolyngbya sp. NK1-12]|uniref:Glycosyltransferase family 4 protein n=1 Tax=Leptolyngbya sp. NK1-12 TaxID=2547451 RepID=A0AA97APB1_9CYAN|nr:glycosyltransferase family 4 protein [Leptolyngbya sp. NK1-12]WNZ27677.1 glycosyltransferase family 4 protein [Leptolyngbya sp. NK1-12]